MLSNRPLAHPYWLPQQCRNMWTKPGALRPSDALGSCKVTRIIRRDHRRSNRAPIWLVIKNELDRGFGKLMRTLHLARSRTGTRTSTSSGARTRIRVRGRAVRRINEKTPLHLLCQPVRRPAITFVVHKRRPIAQIRKGQIHPRRIPRERHQFIRNVAPEFLRIWKRTIRHACRQPWPEVIRR